MELKTGRIQGVIPAQQVFNPKIGVGQVSNF